MTHGGLSGTTVGRGGDRPGVHEDRPRPRLLPPFPVGNGRGEWPSGCRVPDQLAYLMPGWSGMALRGRCSGDIRLCHKASGFGGSSWVPQSSPVEGEGHQSLLRDQLAQKSCSDEELLAQRRAESFLRSQSKLLVGLCGGPRSGVEPLDNGCHFYFVLVEGAVPDSKHHQLLLRAGRPLCHCQGSLSGESVWILDLETIPQQRCECPGPRSPLTPRRCSLGLG